VRDKVELLLAIRSDYDPAKIEDAAVTITDWLRKRHLDGAQIVTAVRHPQDPTRTIANAAAMATAPVIFDVVIALAGEQGQMEALIGATEGIARHYSDVIDSANSAAAAGIEHVIVEGDEPLVHLFALRRLPNISNSEFHHHWITIHSALGHTIPGIGAYNQFHTNPEQSGQAAAAARVAVSDYDGVAETYCRDLDAFNTIMSSAEVAGEGLSDQREFIDASHSTAALYQVLR
jgi:hypothetical protein